MMTRWRCPSRLRVAMLHFVLGMVGLLAFTAPLFAVDPATKEAIRQAEEARQAVRPPNPYSWGPPGWWWIGCPPGQPCPAAPYPAAPVAPYSGAPAPVAPYPQSPQPPASPYPIPVNPAGRVLILVNPVDAEVYVDGVRLQQQADLSYEIGLLAGPHHVQVRKDGFKSYSQRLEIVPGSGLYLPIALEK